MPANLTPEYEKAELRFREANSDEERVVALQAMLSAIPKHKGTEKMQADLKRRISQLRREEQRSGHAATGPDPFHIPRTGAGQVVLIGPPNSGKSSLLRATTKADAKVGDYPFTTVVPQPGIWFRDDVPIELVDTPPMTLEHVPHGLAGTIRNADVVAVVVEAGDAALEDTDEVLELLRARDVRLVSVPRNCLPPQDPNVPGVLVISKVDASSPELVNTLRELCASGSRNPASLEPHFVSSHTGEGLEALFTTLWRLLAMVRVYAKQPGHPPDLRRPFVVSQGATVADLARQIHRDLPDTMKFARLWGHTRFDGQQVHKTEVLQDKDIVEIHE